MNQQEYQDEHYRYNAFREIVEEWHINYDLLRFVAGNRIGYGEYREVFNYNLRPGTVIKVAYKPEVNFTEYSVWEAIKHQPYSKWFAPVIDISPCGHFLLMKKARKITDKDKLPKNIPDMLTDVKKENFGFIGKQFVCVDYQFLSRAFDLAAQVAPRKLKFD